MTAGTTLDSMDRQIKNAEFSTDRWHSEPTVLVALVNDLNIFALWACKSATVHFCGKDDIVSNVTG